MINLTMAAYSSLIATAAIVAILSYTVVFKKVKIGEYNEVFWFSMALAIAWTGTFGIRVWFYIWKSLEEKIQIGSGAWMINHPIVFFLLSLIIIGGLLHVRTLTRAKMGEWGWFSATVAVLCVGLTEYFFG